MLLSNVGNAINLQIESLRQDAINFRLVQVQTQNYCLNSDVVRFLKAGSTETLILHCDPREAGGSLVLQGNPAALNLHRCQHDRTERRPGYRVPA